MKYLIIILITLTGLTSCDSCNREDRITRYQIQQLRAQSSGLSHGGWRPDMTPTEIAIYNSNQKEIETLESNSSSK